MTRWVGLGLALASLLLAAPTSHAQSQPPPDQAAQEPLFISTEVAVDPFDQPPPKRDTFVSASSVGDDIMDPNGLSPHKQLQPQNES